ncbi:MAG: aspartate/glutamate racemase family protein [Pseudomonadota bacterium]
MAKILVINPNSNLNVTDAMADAVAPLALEGGPQFEMHTLATGPIGVQSQADVDAVALPLRAIVAERTDCSVFVIGCFSDPGLAVCREATKTPVLGIRECAVFTALSLGDRFGLVALAPASVKRHTRAFREMAVSERCAGITPLHMSVAEAEEPGALPKVERTAQTLIDDGAEVIILGCTGMARHRAPLEARYGVPVIDPTQAAGAQALGLALLSGSETIRPAADALLAS